MVYVSVKISYIFKNYIKDIGFFYSFSAMLNFSLSDNNERKNFRVN